MPAKRESAAAGTKAAKKKVKPVFDPFERVCVYTSIPLRDPSVVVGGNDPTRPVAAVTPPPPPSSAAGGNVASQQHDGDDDGNTASGAVGEFTASELTITPPLPRTEVALTLRFRVTVALTESDVVYVHLPKFNGPPAQQFGLESLSPTVDARSGGVGIDTASHFRAFWSGTTPKVVSAVHQVEFKRGKKGGAPPKQVLMLQCLKDIPANTLLVFCVPRALGIVTPDRLPANSAKLKLEGPQIYLADSHRIQKQVILTSSEVRKQTVVEELVVYEQCIAQAIRDGGLQADDRQLCEQLSLEEMDQLWQAAQYRRRYPVPMAWTVAEEVFVAYEAAGGFVKRIVQNAISCIKDFDPLAVHKEVARNWGVKPAAVVMLDAFLSVQWAGLYPGIPRASLFAICVMKMEPEDVGRAFLGVPQLPPRTIAEDLMSAFRMRATLDVSSAAATAAAPSFASGQDGGGAKTPKEEEAETEAFMAEILANGGTGNRCAVILDKWAALLTALLPASLMVDSTAVAAPAATTTESTQSTACPPSRHGADGEEHGSPTGDPRADLNLAPDQDGDAHFTATDPRTSRVGRRCSAAGTAATNGSSGAMAVLRPPPTLYIGFRDVPAEAQRALRALKAGEWFVLPFQAVARQWLPYTAVTPSRLAAAASASSGPGSGEDAAGAVADAGHADGELGAGDGGVAAAFIPDNCVVVELRNVVEALELADVTLAPYDRAWLLPLATSCRVVCAEEDQHDVLHVVVDMVGSLLGQINDSYLPQSDRSVAMVVLGKYLAKAEQTDSYVSAFSMLTALYARRNERRRLHPPTLVRAQYLSHCNAAMRASAAKYNVEETERVEWQVRTHEAQLLEEGVVKPAVWEPIQKKYMVTVEQFFLGHSRALQKLEEGTLSVDLGTYTIDYGGKGPRALRRVVDKTYVTHEALPAETLAILQEREEQYTKQLAALDSKLGISPSPAATAAAAGESAKRASAAAGKKKKG